LRRELDDEALDIAPQPKQQPLAGQIDWRNLQAVAGPDDDQRIGRELVYGVVYRRPSEAGDGLQLLHRQEASGLQFAIDQKIFDALVGKFEEVDAITPARGAACVRTHKFESA